MNLQPTLINHLIIMQPLVATDFERLYAVAADPLVWEQHPNKTRYQRPVFENYFEGAMQSKGSLLVLDKASNEVVGCSRYYDYDEATSAVLIGYTFIGRKFWGKQYNTAMKTLMIDHAFQFVRTIYFHIGAANIRSQIAIGRIGAVKKRELAVAYYGEKDTLNFEYALTKEDWINNHKQHNQQV